MIKLNLLPRYVIEVRRIRIVIILFVALLALEGGVVYQAYADMQKQIDWYTKDKDYFTQRATMVKGEKDKRTKLEGDSKVYEPWIKFFRRDAIIKYNDQVATAIEKTANTVSGGPEARPWFDGLTVKSSGDVSANGRIKGMINFLDYYWKMKEANLTLTPQARPAPSPAQPTLNDELSVAISGKIADAAFPTAPEGIPSEKPKLPGELFNPFTSGSGAPRAGGPAVPR